MQSNVKKSVSLSNYTTINIGGNARFFIEVFSIEQMRDVLSYVIKNKIKYFVLGNGSNVVFDNEGFDGIVIKNSIDFISMQDEIIKVGSGFNLSALSYEVSRLDFSGLEFAFGIPATVGGAVYMNAGAFSQSISSVIEEVVFLTEDLNFQTLKKIDLNFDYRKSSFQKMKGVIVSVTLKLIKKDGSLERAKKFLEKRRQSQPLNSKNCGSFFRNPINMSAGKIIHDLGLKGFSIGDAKISEIHANFIINENNATSSDIKKLINHIKKEAREKNSLDLELEVNCIDKNGNINEF